MALRSALARSAKAVGLEGALLVAGTAALAVAASFYTPAGPWIVTGAMATLSGIALALPPRSGDGPHR